MEPAYQSNGVITPEAVVLELPIAGVATRAFARIVDLSLQFALGGILGLLLSWLAAGLGPELIGITVAVFVLVVVPIGSELIWRGRSLGKALFGLRVVGRDGAPEAPRQAVVRGLVALVDIYATVGFLALSSAMLTSTSQRPGDLAAGTVVIRDRARTNTRVPIAFEPPPGHEAFVAQLDVGRLDEEDFSLIRSFLLRVREFDPAARSRIAADLASWTAERLGVTLPYMEHETWLVCVASAFQFRRGGLMADAALGLAPIARANPPR
ncbi:MAG: RDD family protein [Actinomycetes bacterium]